MPLQAYIEAKNALTEGLTLWIGSSLYRKSDIHICDYFYFNSLPGQGVGALYRGLDVAVLTQTGAGGFFATDLNASRGSTSYAPDPEVDRSRCPTTGSTTRSARARRSTSPTSCT